MPHLLKRDRQQFDDWIQEHHAALYRHALWMTSRSDVAEDCVQEAYFQAWKSRKSLKDEAKVFSWLLTILRRMVYREYEQRANNVTCTVDDFSSFPETAVDDDQSKMLDLAKAMQKISTGHRDIILMHGLHGLSYQEISELLEIPAGTVMSRLSRARTALDTALNQAEPEKQSSPISQTLSTSSNAQVINLKTGPYNNER